MSSVARPGRHAREQLDPWSAGLGSNSLLTADGTGREPSAYGFVRPLIRPGASASRVATCTRGRSSTLTTASLLLRPPVVMRGGELPLVMPGGGRWSEELILLLRPPRRGLDGVCDEGAVTWKNSPVPEPFRPAAPS